MKLRNKKTGEIGELHYDPKKEYHFIVVTEDPADIRIYKNLAQLNEEWEDMPEEPKSINEIDVALDAISEYCNEHSYYSGDLNKIKILNIVEEKLKAWKRLKNKGFRFCGYTDDSGDLFSCQVIRCRFNDFGEESREDLDLLFGGENVNNVKKDLDVIFRGGHER